MSDLVFWVALVLVGAPLWAMAFCLSNIADSLRVTKRELQDRQSKDEEP